MRETGPATRALIDAVGRSDGPPPEARARVRAAVAARCASGPTTPSGHADGTASYHALGPSGAVAIVGKVVVVVAALATGAAFATAYRHGAFGAPVGRRSVSSLGKAPPQATQPPVAETVTLSPVGSSDAVGLPAAASPVAAPSPAPSVALSSGRTSSVHDAVSSADLQRLGPTSPQTPHADVAAEVLLLGRASEAMNAGDPSAALSLLKAHARRYPSGALAEERQAALVTTLCALGRTAEASAARDHFLAAYPASPHVDTVRAACAGNAPSIGSRIPDVPATKGTGEPTLTHGGPP